MAHTERGRELTERHRRDQVDLSTTLMDRIMAIFRRTFTPRDIDRGSAEFIRQATPVVLQYREYSASMAVDYLNAFHQVEANAVLAPGDGPDMDPDDPLTVSAPELRRWVGLGLIDRDNADQYVQDTLGTLPDVEELAADLHSSGAAVAKQRIKAGDEVHVARDKAARTVAAKAQRKAADGGVEVIARTVREGRGGATGYVRVPDADPCPFCAMLASRGGVYRSDAFSESNALFAGDGDFKVHDGCGCHLEPVYGGRLTNLPPGVEDLVNQWAEVASGQRDPWGAWRRWRTSGTLPGEERSQVEDRLRPSAPQTGRKSKPGKGRKSIDELDKQELAQALKGMYVRRAGLEKELADLEARGQLPTEPGPAQAIARQLERVEKSIRHGQRRLSKM